jgi:hypothetical protein
MAITVTGTNPAIVTVVSHTITTNTTFNAGAPNDGIYQFDSIIGSVNTGVLVGGFGLQLGATLAGGGVSMTNNGAVIVDGGIAMQLTGNGGAVTYTGTGALINHGGAALQINNIGTGSASATLNNIVSADNERAVNITTSGGAITLTQAAGASLSNTPSSGFTAVLLQSVTGNIVTNIHGTFISDVDGAVALSDSGNITFDVTGTIIARGNHGLVGSSDGAITYNFAGDIFAQASAMRLEADGAGLARVNFTGGQVHTGNIGIEALNQGTGGVLVNMTSGQIGTASQRMQVNGIVGVVDGQVADITITATNVFSNGGSAIHGHINSVTATGDIIITVNGTASSLLSNGISTIKSRYRHQHRDRQWHGQRHHRHHGFFRSVDRGQRGLDRRHKRNGGQPGRPERHL